MGATLTKDCANVLGEKRTEKTPKEEKKVCLVSDVKRMVIFLQEDHDIIGRSPEDRRSDGFDQIGDLLS